MQGWLMRFCKYMRSGCEGRVKADMNHRGALLSDDTAIAAAVGGVSAVLAAGLEYMAFRHRRQYRKVHDTSSKSSSNIALNSFEQ